MKALLPYCLVILIGLIVGFYLSDVRSESTSSIAQDLEIQLVVSQLRVTDPGFFSYIGAYRRVQEMYAQSPVPIGSSKCAALFENQRFSAELRRRFLNQFFENLMETTLSILIIRFSSSSQPGIPTNNSVDSVNSARMQQINAKAENKMRLLLGNKYEEY